MLHLPRSFKSITTHRFICSFIEQSARLVNPSLIPQNPNFYINLLIQNSIRAAKQNAHHMYDELSLRNQALKNCKVLHAPILAHGFELDGKLGDALVDLYAKSGDLDCARKVFNCLTVKNGAAWNSILSSHARSGSSDRVIDEFFTMRFHYGVLPDQFGLAIILSACSRLIILDYGERIHCDIIKIGYESNAFCEGSLIDMYAKCDKIGDSRRVFNGIVEPDTISWTNMIAGYARNGDPEEALNLFSKMKSVGISLDQVTYVTVITACVSIGRLEEAKNLFMTMPFPNVVAWNSIISGYAQNGHEDEALIFFKEMREKDIKPTRSTLGSVLSAAANISALIEGQQIHSEAVRFGLDSNIFVGSSLINMYAKCHVIENSWKVFVFSEERNIVMWNTMLGGCVQNYQPEGVLELFLGMKKLQHDLDDFTFVSAFTACASLEFLVLGRQLHSAVIKNNLESSVFVGNSIVDIYAKLGELNDARKQFDLMPYRDNISWNAIIVGYVHNDREDEALDMFRDMRIEAKAPDEVSISTLLSACSNLRAFEEGEKIHCLAIKHDIVSNICVGSSLVDFYAKHGFVDEASKIFLRMPERNVVSRNALISGHIQNGNFEQAFDLFRQMQTEHLEPSRFTFASILSACSGIFGLNSGKQLHCHILKHGLLYDDEFIATSLLGMYLKSKEFDDAYKFFFELPKSKSLVLWTTMISGLAQNGYSKEALLIFGKMHANNCRSDEASFASVINACAELANLREGKIIHSLIVRSGFSRYENTCGALIDMYSKCGDMKASLQVFQESKNKKDVIIWNSMIVGYAQNGYVEEALKTFNRMQESEINPDDVTCLGVLIACCHAGLVSEGRVFFDSMLDKYGIIPRTDHYACVIDLLGRGGYLNEAEEIILNLPFKPDGVIWGTLLAACKLHGDIERGKLAASKLIELEPHNSSAYVLLANLCAASGDWHGVKMIRQSMRVGGVRKSPGCSWIIVGDKTSVFVSGDKFHPDCAKIYETVDKFIYQMKKNVNVPKFESFIMEEDVVQNFDFG